VKGGPLFGKGQEGRRVAKGDDGRYFCQQKLSHFAKLIGGKKEKQNTIKNRPEKLAGGTWTPDRLVQGKKHPSTSSEQFSR